MTSKPPDWCGALAFGAFGVFLLICITSKLATIEAKAIFTVGSAIMLAYAISLLSPTRS